MYNRQSNSYHYDSPDDAEDDGRRHYPHDHDRDYRDRDGSPRRRRDGRNSREHSRGRDRSRERDYRERDRERDRDWGDRDRGDRDRGDRDRGDRDRGDRDRGDRDRGDRDRENRDRRSDRYERERRDYRYERYETNSSLYDGQYDAYQQSLPDAKALLAAVAVPVDEPVKTEEEKQAEVAEMKTELKERLAKQKQRMKEEKARQALAKKMKEDEERKKKEEEDRKAREEEEKKIAEENRRLFEEASRRRAEEQAKQVVRHREAAELARALDNEREKIIRLQDQEEARERDRQTRAKRREAIMRREEEEDAAILANNSNNPPTDPELLLKIQELVELVLLHGLDYEADFRDANARNPLYRFLFEPRSSHYQFYLWSFATQRTKQRQEAKIRIGEADSRARQEGRMRIEDALRGLPEAEWPPLSFVPSFATKPPPPPPRREHPRYKPDEYEPEVDVPDSPEHEPAPASLATMGPTYSPPPRPYAAPRSYPPPASAYATPYQYPDYQHQQPTGTSYYQPRHYPNTQGYPG